MTILLYGTEEVYATPAEFVLEKVDRLVEALGRTATVAESFTVSDGRDDVQQLVPDLRSN